MEKTKKYCEIKKERWYKMTIFEKGDMVTIKGTGEVGEVDNVSSDNEIIDLTTNEGGVFTVRADEIVFFGEHKKENK